MKTIIKKASVFYFLLIILFLFSCKQYPNENKRISQVDKINISPEPILIAADTLSLGIFNIQLLPNSEAYTITKTAIRQSKSKLRNQLINETITLDSVQSFFTEKLLNDIIPYWYGTQWSFEGHTATPNKGEIACGYFVSTTLKDVGLKLNRYKLAQQSPIDEATIISCGLAINTIEVNDPKKAIIELYNTTKDGFYFIGFDASHVGFLLRRKGKLFLIHSNYLSPVAVCIEPIEQSDVFNSYLKFHIVPISNNNFLINNWIQNKTIL